MNDAVPQFSVLTFAKQTLLPMALVFVIPICGWLFFRHAERWFDDDARKHILNDIRADAQLPPEEKEAYLKFFTEHRFSELLEDPEFAAQIPQRARFEFGTFRWMIRLSALAILSSIGVLLFMLVCLFLSLRSQRAQYYSLLSGWHVMRLYGALQAVTQGAILVGLSYWVTALWMERISVKLIMIVGLLAVCGVGAVLFAIFKRPKVENEIDGTVLPNDADAPWRKELRAICAKVGTAEPDYVIVGIDDGFFVTENPLTVAGKTYEGRKLFMSLALLKQIDGSEAEAILAHEMAHFSGNDTLYSKKIAPLVARFGNYLQSLYESPATKPIFYFMYGFFSLFQVSLSKMSRVREFRADQIAAQNTSPLDITSALMRTVAYSKFRGTIEEELFRTEQTLESANISQRIEAGFPAYAIGFIDNHQVGAFETKHPFDSHPPLTERTSAVGVPVQADAVRARMNRQGDGAWYGYIPQAAELERQQWAKVEQHFRQMHEQSLPYRFLPATDQERAIVLAAFPPCQFEHKKGLFALNYEGFQLATWAAPILFSEITKIENNEGTLKIDYNRGAWKQETLAMNGFRNQQEVVLDALNRYYGRFLSAQEYQKLKNTNTAREGA